MNKNHQLPIGDKLAGHYEIINILGEDEFEILYLVKDLHMAEQKFVLKELFLNSYASRKEDNSVQVMAKSKEAFRQTKKDIISEIETLKSSQSNAFPKYYGYFEENNTIYSIMEFVNSSNFSVYLKANSKKEEQVEPKIVAPSIAKEKPKSKIFLKILMVTVLIFIILLYYGYSMIQKDKAKAKNKSVEVVVKSEPMKHPPLKDKTKKMEEENLSSIIQEKKKKVKPEGASYVEVDEMLKEDLETPLVIVEDLSELPIAETYVDIEPNNNRVETTQIEETPIIYEPNVMETPIPNREIPSFSLGSRIN